MDKRFGTGRTDPWLFFGKVVEQSSPGIGFDVCSGRRSAVVGRGRGHGARSIRESHAGRLERVRANVFEEGNKTGVVRMLPDHLRGVLRALRARPPLRHLAAEDLVKLDALDSFDDRLVEQKTKKRSLKLI